MSLPLLGVCFFAGITLFFFLLGRLTSGTGADLIDWDPAGRADQRRSLEQDDVAQMLETANRRRRAQGLPELAEGEVLTGLRRR
ncbi:MAG: hypothetical protein JWN65_1467 [Solirubrobacterales bacterium]|jgi:hypothetical protein|nr:hypothetical protein [Solirubrobacterales bacterium]